MGKATKASLLEQRDPPQQTRRFALSASDELIVNALDEPKRPVQVAQQLGRRTQYISARLRELTRRGWLERIPTEQVRGPGANLYVALPRE